MPHPCLPLAGRRRLLAAAGLALTGCQWLPREAVVPMPAIALPGPCGGASPERIVLLPGAYSRPEEFVDEGFVAALRAAGCSADVVIADAHLGYFRARNVLERLHRDVLLPARAAGVRRLWLVGISLGGFGALGCASQYPGAVDGVVALAPYLGQPPLIGAIAGAGGARAWAARAPAPDEPPEAALWRWLAAPPPGAPPVYLGYGREDRLAAGHRLLAGLLPAERVSTVPGGHDWPPWRALWQAWLARGLLATGCGAPG